MRIITNNISARSVFRHLDYKAYDAYFTLSAGKVGVPHKVFVDTIDLLMCKIEKAMVSPRYHLEPPENRILYIGMGENIDDDINMLHFHCLGKFQDHVKSKFQDETFDVFERILKKKWASLVEPTMEVISVESSLKGREVVVSNGEKALVKNRFCDVQPVSKKTGQRVVDYVTKELDLSDNEEHIIFNHQTRSRSKRREK